MIKEKDNRDLSFLPIENKSPKHLSVEDIKKYNDDVYALYPSVGENLDFIKLNKLKNIQFLYRKIDQLAWQYCNKGFFNFKNYIPKIIQNIS